MRSFLKSAHVFRQALISAMALLNLGWAQAAPIGTVYHDVLVTEASLKIPLPAGGWRLMRSGEGSQYGGGAARQYDFNTLESTDPKSDLIALFIASSKRAYPWTESSCGRSPANSILQSYTAHNPKEVDKCITLWGFNAEANRKYADANPTDLIAGEWAKASELFRDVGIAKNPPLFLRIAAHRFTDRRLLVFAVLRAPPPGNADAFIRAHRAAKSSQELDYVKTWSSIYLETLQKVSLDEQSQAMTAYRLPDRGPGRAQTAVQTPPPPPSPVSAAPAAPPPRPAAPEVGTAAPGGKTKPAPSAGSQTALDTEKAEMAQQLAEMRKMLSSLQAANEAAIAAARAASEAAQSAQKQRDPQPSPQQKEAPAIFANRRALVIGNDKYTQVPALENATADANAMGKALEKMGYRVTTRMNLNEKEFKQALREFRMVVQGGDEVMFFFAGHGVQLGSANYLLPVDIRGDNEEQVKDEAIELQRVLDDFRDRKTKFALAVVDACRDNPFKSKGRAIGSRGLAPTTAATGQMIMFSAGAGQQALDRLGPSDREKNGVFTRVFLREMAAPGVTVDKVLRNVRNEVVRMAGAVGHEQTPALYDQSIGDFYFLR